MIFRLRHLVICVERKLIYYLVIFGFVVVQVLRCAARGNLQKYKFHCYSHSDAYNMCVCVCVLVVEFNSRILINLFIFVCYLLLLSAFDSF